MQSLLGQFYSRIKGSQEDIASEGLTYILQRSKVARLAINKVIKSDCNLDFEDISFTTQNIGDQLERPDISGYNLDGKEVLILEAKFWAALTHNQPIEYLYRLKENSALIFICPTLRVRPVFDELLKRVTAIQLNHTVNVDAHLIGFENNKFLFVKTWNEILNTIRLHLVQENEQALISDIDQIIGLCDTIDSNSFLPLQSDDLSPKFAKRINSYYDLIDKVVDELKKKGLAVTKDLRSAAQKYSYTRYFKTPELGASLNIKFEFWAECADTPIWINFKDDTSGKIWIARNEFRKTCKIVASQLGYTTFETNSKELFLHFFL
ncbi:MAG: hypothetical protein ACXWEY_06695 [Bacteroidia bacterium]